MPISPEEILDNNSNKELKSARLSSSAGQLSEHDIDKILLDSNFFCDANGDAPKQIRSCTLLDMQNQQILHIEKRIDDALKPPSCQERIWLEARKIRRNTATKKGKRRSLWNTMFSFDVSSDQL